MKYFLLFLLVIIMAAGARSMFLVAYYGAVKEHQFGPDAETSSLIYVSLWFVLMMVGDVLLLGYPQAPKRNLWIALLTVGVVTPVVYLYMR